MLVWSCISARGVGDLFKIDDIMNAEKYRQILIHHAVPSGRQLVVQISSSNMIMIQSTLLRK